MKRMDNIKIATAQFEHKSGDKSYNLSMIRQLSAAAKERGAQVVAFHECSITGYSFARKLSNRNCWTWLSVFRMVRASNNW